MLIGRISEKITVSSLSDYWAHYWRWSEFSEISVTHSRGRMLIFLVPLRSSIKNGRHTKERADREIRWFMQYPRVNNLTG